jgi:hypothetical protein
MNKPTPLGKKSYAEYAKEMKKFKNLTEINFNKTYKINLGLIDDFSYGDVSSLEDEASRLSYSTEEWYDEKLDEFLEVRGMLRDVYINGSEAFINEADVAGDRDILAELQTTADEIGVPVDELYPDYDEHLRILDDIDYLTGRFDDQVRELEGYGL